RFRAGCIAALRFVREGIVSEEPGRRRRAQGRGQREDCEGEPRARAERFGRSARHRGLRQKAALAENTRLNPSLLRTSWILSGVGGRAAKERGTSPGRRFGGARG